MQGQIADLVQKDRPSVGGLKQALVSLVVRPGKCPLLIAKQLRLYEIFWNGPTVYLQIRPVFPGAVVYNQFRNNFLSRSGFTQNQYGGSIKCGHPLCQCNNFVERLAVCNNGPLTQADPHALQLAGLLLDNRILALQTVLEFIEGCDIPDIVKYIFDISDIIENVAVARTVSRV